MNHKIYVKPPSRFDKTKTIEEGYMELWYMNNYTMVNIDHNIMSMKQFQGFCACNELPSGRFAKLQGGYYVLNKLAQWEFIGTALSSISFRTVFDALKSLRMKKDSEGILRYIEN